jgi:toxin ParE1/3/4
MKHYTVIFSDRAEANFQSIFRYIAKKSSARIAAGYLRGIRDECMTLSMLPNRGTQHPHLREDVRTTGYRGSATISFRVSEDVVTILGVYYRGRNVKAQIGKLTD